MKPFSPRMYENLQLAVKSSETMHEEDRKLAGQYVRRLIRIKHELEALAIQRGFSQACKDAITTCRGECCRYHFPRILIPAEFFAAIYQMSPERQAALSELVLKNVKNRCPMLLKTGCFLSFEERPVTCTNAYPCFADRAYWVEKEKKREQMEAAFTSLSTMISNGPGPG